MKTHTTLKSKLNAAFSLVELLVVIAVIAVIAAIAIPNIAGTREAAEQASTDYRDATLERLTVQARGAGATEAELAALAANGTVTLANGITFTVDEAAAAPAEGEQGQ